MTVTYIFNRLPLKSIKNNPPFKVVFKQKPTYDHMQILGCLVYVINNETRGEKFQVRGTPVFIGFPQSQKVY